MNRPPTSLELCERWRLLSEAEGDAILAADWSKVAEAQAAKLELQTLLDAARQREGANVPAPLAAHLIALEHRNQDRLRVRQQAAHAAQAELELAGQNLRRVHRAYAPGPPPRWNSFS